MNFVYFSNGIKGLLFLCLLGFTGGVFAQIKDNEGRWQFGGGIGVSVGSGFTDVTLAPGALYNFNQYVAVGLGVQGSYVRAKGAYESYIYGGSVSGLFNPLPQIQLSAELEELRVNTHYSSIPLGQINTSIIGVNDKRQDNFWNTALYLGAGYRVENVTIGIRYNVLYDSNKSVYSEPYMPFIRAYF